MFRALIVACAYLLSAWVPAVAQSNSDEVVITVTGVEETAIEIAVAPSSATLHLTDLPTRRTGDLRLAGSPARLVHASS